MEKAVLSAPRVTLFHHIVYNVITTHPVAGSHPDQTGHMGLTMHTRTILFIRLPATGAMIRIVCMVIRPRIAMTATEPA